VKFIREHKREPFFLYFAHTFPHVPLFASQDFSGQESAWPVRRCSGGTRLERRPGSGHIAARKPRRKYTCLLHERPTGRADSGRARWPRPASYAAAMGSTWEGGYARTGHRLVAWPDQSPFGDMTAFASTMDLFATSLKLAGAELPPQRVLDGIDLSPTLLEGKSCDRKRLLFSTADSGCSRCVKGRSRPTCLRSPATATTRRRSTTRLCCITSASTPASRST